MRRLILAVLIVLVLPASAQASVLLGSQIVQATQDGGASASEAFGYTATATGSVTSISAYLDSTTGVQLGLYSDNAGVAGTKLTSGTVTTNVAGWVTVTVPATSVTSGTKYWLVIAANGTSSIGYRDMGTGGTALDYSGTALSSPYQTNGQWSSNPASVYASSTDASQAPVNTVAPSISGLAQQGQILTAVNGTWTGTAPITYTYNWRWVGYGSNITTPTYALTANDVGHKLDVTVTATNSVGHSTATSLPTATVTSSQPTAPADTVLPSITGTAQSGQTLTASTGTWAGTTPLAYGYQWQRAGVNVAGATSATYLLSTADVGSTVDVIVTATNSVGHASATSAPSATVTASGGLPPGVTLQAIDGGPNFYCTHGFTAACANGWDSPSFFSIGPWWGNWDATVWPDVGWNTAWRYSGADIGALNAAGVSTVIASNDDTSGGFEAPMQSKTVGLVAQDEPNCWNLPCPGPNAPYPAVAGLSSSPNSIQNGKFWYVNDTWNFLRYGPPTNTPGGTDANFFTDPVTTPDGTTRHLDIGSVDEYWFSDVVGTYPTTYEGGLQYGLGHDLTVAQTECGCRYGDMIDNVPGTNVGLDPNGTSANDIFQREVQDPASPQGNPNSVLSPIPAFVEDGNVGADAAGTITPPQMNWAVWSSIIHGARSLIYFDHSFAGPCQGDANILNTCYQTPYSGQTISIYAQVKATDALVSQTATAINSPVALGYITVQGAAGSLNGPPATFSGIETRATYSAAGGFTVFADTRDAETSAPAPVTFHTADSYTGPVTVLCDTRTGGDGHLNPGTCVNRTVAATNGTFTDTFASGSTVHIYQIP